MYEIPMRNNIFIGEARSGILFRRGLAEDDFVPAFRLCLVEGVVSGTKQLGHGGAGLRETGNSQRKGDGGEDEFFVSYFHFFDLLAYHFRAFPCFLERRAQEDEHELLASVAAGDVSSPDTRFQETAEREEQSVSCAMAVGIVELLEVIYIDHDNADPVFRAFCLMQ